MVNYEEEENPRYKEFEGNLVKPEEWNKDCCVCKTRIEMTDITGKPKYDWSDFGNNLFMKWPCCSGISHTLCSERICGGRYTKERKNCAQCFAQIDAEFEDKIITTWNKQNHLKSNDVLRIVHEDYVEDVLFRKGATLTCYKYKTPYKCDVIDARIGWTLVKYNEIDYFWNQMRI